jgi:hypothetical protein
MDNVRRARRSVAHACIVVRPPLRVIPFDSQWQLRHFFGGVSSLPLPRSRIGLVGINTAGLLY